MDALNKFTNRLTDMYRSLTPAARITAALLIAVTVACVAWLYHEQVNGADAYLMGGQMFSAGQLRDMEAAFGKAGLQGYQFEGARIKVPRTQQSKFMAALAEADALPRDFGMHLQKAATSSGFMPPSQHQQDSLTKIARQRELQEILNEMNGVERSAVHIDEQTSRSFPPTRLLTASVSVMPKGQKPLDDGRISAIRHLVSASVAGLKPESVTIIDLASGRAYPGNGGGARSAGALGEYAELKRYYEHEFQQKINHVLAYIPGVLVTTSVELDPEVLNEEQSTKYDDRSVVYETREVTKTVEPPAAQSRGAAHGSAKPGDQASSSTARGEDVTQTDQRKAVPTTQRHIIREGRTPRRVTASVAVPSSYYERVYRTLHPGEATAPDAQQLADLQAVEQRKIEELVAPLLPSIANPGDLSARIAVSTFHQLPDNPPAAPTPGEELLWWLRSHAPTLGLAALVVVGLVMLRWVFTAAVRRPSTLVLETPSGPVRANESLARPADEHARTPLPRRAASSSSLKDELADMVRDDPAAAVSILRNWIGNVN